MKLVAGLGNPGAKYRNTRHNVGFHVLDELAALLGTQFAREKYGGLIAEGRCAGEKVLLLKPLTFMNLSGECVARAARYRAAEPGDLLIIYDDVELPLGRLRLRGEGSAGTHNGMKSVLQHLGTNEIPRLRMGVGKDMRRGGLSDHVLGTFRPEEKGPVREMVELAAKAALHCIEQGLPAAMNEFNRKEP